MVKEPFLSPQTTTVAHKGLIAADYPVARYKNGKVIPAVSGGYRSDGLQVTILTGKLVIADGFTVRDLIQ